MSELGQNSALLSAAELNQLGDLMFIARKMVEGVYSGRHRSTRRGQSAEFYDYRAYAEGDDPQRVDWKVFGRSDRLYVRRHRHDAQLNMHLLIDRSASMDFSGLDARGRARKDFTSKWTCARQLAAALALLAVRQTDRVGLHAFDQVHQQITPSGTTSEHLNNLVQALQTMQTGGAGDPVRALAQAHATITQRHQRSGLLILISDLQDDAGTWLKAMHPFLHSHFDIVVLHVLTPQETDLREIGGLRLIDSETRDSVRTFGPSIQQAYRKRMRDHLASLQRGFAQHRVDYHLMLTNESPVEALSAYVHRRGAAGLAT